MSAGQKKTAGVPAVCLVRGARLVCLCACLSSRRAVREPKVRKEEDGCETHGREYFFVSKEDFEVQRDRGDFLEWAEVHGNYYGTSRGWIEDQIRQSRNILLEIDWQGAQQIRALFQSGPIAPRSVFILPPSLEELAHRLRNRGQDSEAVIARRLAAAEEEISHAKEFDYVIINQDFSHALGEFEAIAESVLKPS